MTGFRVGRAVEGLGEGRTVDGLNVGTEVGLREGL